MSKSTSLSDFFTRSNANQGIELPLYLPDGSKSEHWLRIVGVDSDLFRHQELIEKRGVLAYRGKPQAEVDAAAAESRLRLLAAIITEWSFPEECSQENKVNLLREAPQIAEAINTHSADRTLFFANASKNSADSQKPTSD